MATIKCTKCGSKIENVTSGSVECPNCRHKMRYISKKSNTNPQSNKTANQAQINNKKTKIITTQAKIPQTKKKKGCIFYFLLVIAVMLFIIVIVGTMPSSKNKKTEKNIAHRENMYGLSDKDIDDVDKKLSITNVENDVTGKWKLARIADDINIEEYALSYYNKYFEDGDIVHAIVNFNYRTTTKLSVIGDKLDVEVHEYVDKEEHDAKKLFSGMVYEHFQIYTDNGDIEKLGMVDMSSEENVNIDATPDNFLNDIKNIEIIKEDESIMDIKLENKDLRLYIDLSKVKLSVSRPPEDTAGILSISIGDAILTLNGYDDLWDTITFDFGDVGKITREKADIEITETGRYFVGNPVLE